MSEKQPLPLGRPIGRGAVALARAEFRDEGKLTKLIARLYELADAGDMAAARLLLERIVPAYRPHAMPVHVELPRGSLTEQAKALLSAAASGELSTDQAAELIGAVSRIVAVEQGDEIRRKLNELEHGDLA